MGLSLRIYGEDGERGFYGGKLYGYMPEGFNYSKLRSAQYLLDRKIISRKMYDNYIDDVEVYKYIKYRVTKEEAVQFAILYCLDYSDIEKLVDSRDEIMYIEWGG